MGLVKELAALLKVDLNLIVSIHVKGRRWRGDHSVAL
jgi:hypothetical protein